MKTKSKLFAVFAILLFLALANKASADGVCEVVYKENNQTLTSRSIVTDGDKCDEIQSLYKNDGSFLSGRFLENAKQAQNTAISSTTSSAVATATSGSFTYQLLEAIPGVFSAGATPDFNAYVSGIYKFLILVVGICALFMITVGGYMYIISAGNNATMGKAKSIITDAIIGLVLALLAYLIFYTINPNLTSPTGLQPISGVVSNITTGGAGLSSYTDQEVRAKLKSMGVDVKVSNTSVAGLQDGTIALAGKIGGTVTGGTENIAHSTTGDHPQGKAIDVRITPEVKTNILNEIKNNPNIDQVCAKDRSLCHNCSQEACAAEPDGIVHVSIK